MAAIKSHLGHLVAWKHPAEGKLKARVLIAHGIGEHSGRHLNTVAHLVANGYEVYRFDFRGAGESGGERQYVDSFEDYVTDLVKVYHWVIESETKQPLFLLGHSLGGAISILFAARYGHELTGLLLNGPAFLVGSAISPVKIAVGRVLARWLPSMRLPGSTDIAAVSRDPQVVEAYENDPLACRFNTLRQGSEVLDTLENMIEPAQKIRCRTLITHGTADRIVRAEGSFQLLMNLNATREKELHLFPGAYHELHNDTDKALYFELITRWMDQIVSR